ncbi:MAG: hypothetical protein LBE91_16455 [Tannerella sp.]|nr:hypothetical protein [Tannerella sp.]
MMDLDKIKMITSIKNMERFDENKFQSVILDGKIRYHEYRQKKPYDLSIMINHEKEELAIEFTSKISELSFFDLINESTIDECFCVIEEFVEFDEEVRDILDEFEVVKCDVTKDIPFTDDIKKLKRYILSNLKNYDKWKCEPYRGGFTLSKIVGTKGYKKRLSIYPKAHELKLRKNRAFVEEVDNFDEGDSYVYDDHFRDIIRFEMNINTKAQIRELLNIPDNKLSSVLSSSANPILDVLNEALKEPEENNSVLSAWKEYKDVLVLKDCDNNLGKVENKIRSLTSKNTSITRMMKPYRELHKRLQNKPSFDLRKLVV